MTKVMTLLIMSFLVLALQLAFLFLELIVGIEMKDYSIIIWNFAVSTVIVVAVMAFVKRRKKKKKKGSKKITTVYSKPEEQYRTEYY